MDIKVNRAAVDAATKKLRNWGRWGKDDRIGTLNFIGPEENFNSVRGGIFGAGSRVQGSICADRP